MSWADVLSVMLARWVMCDVRQSAPRGGPLIGAEPRGFPPREESLVAWRSRGGLTGSYIRDSEREVLNDIRLII